MGEWVKMCVEIADLILQTSECRSAQSSRPMGILCLSSESLFSVISASRVTSHVTRKAPFDKLRAEGTAGNAECRLRN